MDWHSQVCTIFEMLLQVQQFLPGIKWTFVIDRKQLSRTVCIWLPIMVVMGDMQFLNKLVHFRGGLSLQSCACCLCNITLDKCDDPYEPYGVTILYSLIQDIQNNPNSFKQVVIILWKTASFINWNFVTVVESMYLHLYNLFFVFNWDYSYGYYKGLID